MRKNNLLQPVTAFDKGVNTF